MNFFFFLRTPQSLFISKKKKVTMTKTMTVMTSTNITMNMTMTMTMAISQVFKKTFIVYLIILLLLKVEHL